MCACLSLRPAWIIAPAQLLQGDSRAVQSCTELRSALIPLKSSMGLRRYLENLSGPALPGDSCGMQVMSGLQVQECLKDEMLLQGPGSTWLSP